MKNIFDRSVESFALTLFLLYIHLADMGARADWLMPYLLASSLGIAATAYLWHRKVILNRLFLGITLYFCSGLAGLVTDWDWLNQHYGELGAVAMLGWILLTGIITSVTSRYGFLGSKTPSYFSTLGSSALLLLACLMATAAAISFMGNKLLGEWLPFIFLFSLRSLLLHLDRKMLRETPVAA